MQFANLVTKRKSITKEKEILLKEFGCCEVCGYDFKPTLQVHHIIPVSKGGSNDLENLSLLCPNCHSLIHSLMSDATTNSMDAEEMDKWINQKFNTTQKDKLFYYALRLLRSGDEE